MFFDDRHDLAEIPGTAQLFTDVGKRQELVTHNFSQPFGKLLLPLGKNTVKSDPQEAFRLTRVKKHFDGHPVGNPSDEGRDQG